MFGDIPYVNMIDLIDGVKINNNFPVQFISNTKAKKNISLNNLYTQKISGMLRYSIIDLETDKRVMDSVAINLKPKGRFDITIPITLGLTLIVLYAIGYTLNIMTLGAIAAAIGLIIDDAIVVVEQIHRTHEEHPDEQYTGIVQKAIHYLL